MRFAVRWICSPSGPGHFLTLSFNRYGNSALVDKLLEFGSLFSGVGGLDLGLEQAGLKCTFQVENDKHCLTILNRHFPDVPKNEVRPCMGIVGGDPCPIRSTPSAFHGTRKPDLSGYFLAMVYRCKPRWILRENVPAPDVLEFGLALDCLSYFVVVVSINSAAFTGQSRNREFVAGFDNKETLDRFRRICENTKTNKSNGEKRSKNTAALLGINTRRGRSGYRENHVFEGPKRGLRVLSHNERESLQGFPAGWTDGIPNSARERSVGNAVTVPVAKWLGERIVEALIINQ